MNWKEITQLSRPFSPAAFIEKILPSSIRALILRVSLVFVLFFIFVFVFVPSVSLSVTTRGIFLFLSVYLSFFMLEVFFRSYAFRFSDIDILHSQKKTVSFDVASVIFETNSSDITKGFFVSSFGKEIATRLGLSQKEMRFFLNERSSKVMGNNLSFKTHISLSLYAEALFESDAELSNFLFSKNIQREEWVGAVIFVENMREWARRKKRWWSRENLARVKSIGSAWSYGETFFLDKYARTIEPSSSGRFDREVEILETILSRAREANAVLVSDTPSFQMEVLSAIAAKIQRRTVFSPIEHKQIKVFETENFIAVCGGKAVFERELLKLLNQAEKAGDIILVIPNFTMFIRNALSLGSDATALLEPFLTSQSLQCIALADAAQFQQTIVRDERLERRFEKLRIEEKGFSGILQMLESAALTFEDKDKVFFTYQAVRAIAYGVERYITSGSLSEKALDLLVELVPIVKKSGKKIIEDKDVFALIESKTGIPTSEVKGSEKKILTNLEEVLHRRIVGQDMAVSAVSIAMKRARSGIANPHRPLGSFLFLGPTGVGKTETSKALAEIFFGNEAKMMRLDMSEYNSLDALDRLIGSFTTGTAGVLASMVREYPYGVLLLDEFEKAHSEVHDLFLQVLDEGMFSDMFGKKVNARNLIIIATSNAGSDIIWNMVKEGKSLAREKETLIDALIQKRIFKPEFLNRFDGIIIFHPLQEEHLKKIAELMLNKLKKRLYEKGYDLEITPALIDFLVREGSDPQFGARPLNRAIQEKIEKVIAEEIISGALRPGSKVVLREDDLR